MQLSLIRQTAQQDFVKLEVALGVPDCKPVEHSFRVPLRTGVSSDDRPSWIRRVSPNEFRNQRTGENFSAEELTRFLTLNVANTTASSTRRVPPEIEQVLRRISILYLDADRLRTTIREESLRRNMRSADPEDKDEYSINEIAKRVGLLLRRSRFLYGQAGRDAERSFPARVLQALRQPEVGTSVSPQDLQDRFTRLRHAEAHLQALSLTDGVMEALPDNFLDAEPTALLILGQYLDDLEERFRLLQHDAQQMTLFRDTLNNMLEGKVVRFALDVARPRNSLEVVAVDGTTIPLTSLSSGEQQLVVMLGRLLFPHRTQGPSLVLLDEPEISLHPQWQVALSRALKQVAAVTHCRMLLATHSPTMIDNDWDSEIDLVSSQGA